MSKEMRDTSLTAYHDLIQSGQLSKDPQSLGKLEQKIFDIIVMFDRPFTDSELTRASGLKDTRQCPRRRYDLYKKGLLNIDHKGECPITQKYVIYWRLSIKGKTLAQERKAFETNSEQARDHMPLLEFMT